MRIMVWCADFKSQRVAHPNMSILASLVLSEIATGIWCKTTQGWQTFAKSKSESWIWVKKRIGRGRTRPRLIWGNIFIQIWMILKDSLQMPKKPENCSSPCSMPMVLFSFPLEIGREAIKSSQRNEQLLMMYIAQKGLRSGWSLNCEITLWISTRSLNQMEQIKRINTRFCRSN